jgi:GNAT superfamily N-acetyltransferase
MNPSGRPPLISLATLREEHVSAVVALLLAQETRQRERDARLQAVRSGEQITALLTERLTRREPSLVALDAQRRVRGYACPGVWSLAETSILRAFLSARNGVARDLTLPDPHDGDAPAVLATLLAALSTWWKDHDTTGELIRWPSADQWLVARLAAHGFQLDSVCALRGSHATERHGTPSTIITQRAAPVDEEALIDLFAEELRYHERFTPFVRCHPAVLAALRRKLARLWAGASLEEGAPLVLVAECEGKVVGMAETALLTIAPDDEPRFTPPGRYGCIDNVCVREALRRQGIGHLLVQAVDDTFAALPLALDGWLLWYNPENPQAAHFWPRQGFVPLWTTYQRLHPTTKDEAGS